MIGKNSVFSRNGYYIAGNAYGTEVKQGYEFVELNAVVACKSLHEFESHAASAQVGIGISGILPLGIEYGYGIGQLGIGNVVIANYYAYPARVCISHFFDCFYAAIENYHQLHPRFKSVVYTAFRQSVAFVVAVGDVVINV